MTLFILSSNNERIPFHQPQKTPLVFASIQRLKEQERKHHSTVKRTKEDTMKQKQFGTLDIVITKRKIQVHTSPAKKRKGCESKSIDRMLFPENLDDSFHQGLLGNMESGFENTMPMFPQEVSKPHIDILVKESKKPKLTTTSSSCDTEETTVTKTAQVKFTPKFKIPETPLLNNISSETHQLGKSFIPESPQFPMMAHRKRNWLTCSTVPETPLLDASPMVTEYFERQPIHLYTPETPVAQMKNKKKDINVRRTKNWGKRYVQVVPETPNLKLKSTEELSLYD